VFALDLMSTYEGEYMIFGLLGQGNLTQNDVLQFYPFTSEWSRNFNCFELGFLEGRKKGTQPHYC
jgi:hypothetical protein